MITAPSPECLEFLKRHVAEERFGAFLQACSTFQEILYETNKTMNLTRIPPEEFWSKHIADSVSIAPYLNGKFNLCDVGCGAGFPSLPLAAAFPELQVTAVDSTRKKIDFVNQRTVCRRRLSPSFRYCHRPCRCRFHEARPGSFRTSPQRRVSARLPHTRSARPGKTGAPEARSPFPLYRHVRTAGQRGNTSVHDPAGSP